MKDLFNDQHPEDAQATRAMPPVDNQPSRRRRAERFAGLIDEKDAVLLQEEPSAPKEVPTETRMTPPVQAETRAQRPVPSQGVPRPAALGGRPQRETHAEEQGPMVRRPVQAEGYTSLQQLGTQSQPRVRRPETELHMEPRRIHVPEMKNVAYEDLREDEEDDQPQGVNRGLIAVVAALLVLGALILGLIMIPEDQPGALGSFKRAVTEPIRGLLGGEETETKTAADATASGFNATVSQATAPYKVVFHVVTSANVTAVRLVDESGEVIPTTTTLSTPSSEDAIVWMFELVRESSYIGAVQAQIQTGEGWLDTHLWQTLNLGGTTPAVTGTSSPTGEPTTAPVVVLTGEPEEAATATPAPATDAPTETPAPATATPENSPEVTATPTLSVTATPTLVPTETPTEAPTPTPEPTEAPTPTPAPTPVATPKLEANAVEAAAPSLITVEQVYKDNKKTDAYEREKPINMQPSDDYLTRAFGVTTYRGNAFRQNAAVETVENPTSLALAWTVEAGSVAGSSRTYYGIGWTGQPVIAKWPSDIRASMDLEQARKDQKHLTEVIVSGMDGMIYFLDLNDGTATREAIEFGFPMRSTPSLHPLSYPMMTSGQYARKMKSGTSDNIGLYYFSLMDQKKLRMIDGIDRKLNRPYNAVGAFDTSALIDRSTNTLIAIGTNGLLYTEKLNMSMMLDNETGNLIYEFNEPTEVVTLMSHTKGQRNAYAAVESSLAMYGSYAYYADLEGILRCVDTTTMTTAWAVDTGDAVRAAIALDLEETESGSTLWLYTANLMANRGARGNVTIRRYNAMTGEEDWAYAIHTAETKKKDVTFNNTVIPGAMASPVIGQHGLDEMVYFTLSSVSAQGAEEAGFGSAALPGVLIALNKETGKVAWHKALDAYSYSSPVAVYDESGKGWIIQACATGHINLMDGLTGEVISTLQVNGVIEGSPAVFGDMMVIGTTGKGTSYIYGIKIN